jgi:hypothetical protein
MFLKSKALYKQLGGGTSVGRRKNSSKSPINGRGYTAEGSYGAKGAYQRTHFR